jgi:hypothetical protein
MGGGGGSLEPVSRKDPDWLSRIRHAEPEQYEAATNALLGDLSADLGTRDNAAIHQHVETLRQALQNYIAESIDIEFGGSLSKHTYVDGVSDVDVLVVLRPSDAKEYSPEELIAEMGRLARDRLPNTTVATGDMAVTVTYSDGIKLQLLPAIRRGDRVQVPAGGGGGWSPVASPASFATELRKANARCALGVLPTIKLFKAIQDAKIPGTARLKGYHVEALALELFASYTGPLERKAMLEAFVEFASTRVVTPIRDATGQSDLVDGYLGQAHSSGRRTSAAYLRRLAGRMKAADQEGNVDTWVDLFQ